MSLPLRTPLYTLLILVCASIATRALGDDLPRFVSGHPSPQSCAQALVRKIFSHPQYKDLNQLRNIEVKLDPPNLRLERDLDYEETLFSIRAKDAHGVHYQGYATFALTCREPGQGFNPHKDRDDCYCSLPSDWVIPLSSYMKLTSTQGEVVFDSACAGGYYGEHLDERCRSKP